MFFLRSFKNLSLFYGFMGRGSWFLSITRHLVFSGAIEEIEKYDGFLFFFYILYDPIFNKCSDLIEFSKRVNRRNENTNMNDTFLFGENIKGMKAWAWHFNDLNILYDLNFNNLITSLKESSMLNHLKRVFQSYKFWTLDTRGSEIYISKNRLWKQLLTTIRSFLC